MQDKKIAKEVAFKLSELKNKINSIDTYFDGTSRAYSMLLISLATCPEESEKGIVIGLNEMSDVLVNATKKLKEAIDIFNEVNSKKNFN